MVPVDPKLTYFYSIRDCLGLYLAYIGLNCDFLGLYWDWITRYREWVRLYWYCFGLYCDCLGLYCDCLGLYLPLLELYWPVLGLYWAGGNSWSTAPHPVELAVRQRPVRPAVEELSSSSAAASRSNCWRSLPCWLPLLPLPRLYTLYTLPASDSHRCNL